MEGHDFALFRSGPGFVGTRATAGQLEIELRLIEQLVLRAFELERETLLSPGRGPAPVAFARQVAIYVVHVQLGLTLTAAATLFRRDRTTAAHACRVVEDRRERPDIDRRVTAIETALDRWVGLRPIREGLR